MATFDVFNMQRQKVGSIDLAAWGGYQALISGDKAKRAEAVKKTAEQVIKAIKEGRKPN